MQGRRLWNVVPKFHYWWHAAVFSKDSNPRAGWVFRDEDLVGRVTKIGHSCTFGTHSMYINVPVIHKYREAMSLRVSKRALWG